MNSIHERLAELRGRPKIALDHVSAEGLGLIILRPSGVFYTHQAGGMYCCEVQDEGVFAPLYQQVEDQQGMLYDHFNWRYGNFCDGPIEAQDADYIDHVLSLSPDTQYLKVDRTRLADSMESWVYVDVQEPIEYPDVVPISGFGTCKGVLIWPNID